MTQENDEKKDTPSSPRLWLMIGLGGCFLGYIFFAFIYRILDTAPTNSLDNQINQASALFLALTGLFAGSNVYLTIYDYVNHCNQLRGWRHDYAIRNMRDIYAPLWEETQGLLSNIGGYRGAYFSPKTYVFSPGLNSSAPSVSLGGFKELFDSHLQFFTDIQLKELLSTFHQSIKEYNKVMDQIREQMPIEIKRTISNTDPFKKWDAPKIERLSDSIWSNRLQMADYTSLIISESLDDGKKNVLQDQIVSAIKGNIQAGTITDDKYIQISNDILTSLRNIGALNTLYSLRTNSLTKGKVALERIRMLIYRPENALLEVDKPEDRRANILDKSRDKKA